MSVHCVCCTKCVHDDKPLNVQDLLSVYSMCTWYLLVACSGTYLLYHMLVFMRSSAFTYEVSSAFIYEAHYLSEVKCFSNRRLLSRFRSGCHGLRFDTGRWENNVHLDRKDRLCLACSSAQDVEDEHHFLFDCPAYSSIRASHANLFQCACSVFGFFDNCEANACGGFIRNCFSLRSSILTDFT